MTLRTSPAAPLDAEPALYRGLGVTALVRLLAGSAAVWSFPSAIAAIVLADGIGILMVLLTILIITTALSTLTAATLYRRLERNRPFNWVNRALIVRLPDRAAGILVQHEDLWSP